MRPATTAARLVTALVAVLACCPVAFAQPGPAPGQDPLGYAVGYAQGHAANATSDPAGHVGRTATPEGIGNATGEAGYVACWALYDATGLSPDAVCAGFFTTPGEVEPEPEGNGTALNATLVEDAAGQAAELANATVDAVQAIVEDPASAPQQAQGLADAALGFLAWLADALLGAVAGLLDGIAAAGVGVADLGASAADAVAGLGAAVGDALDAGLTAIGEATLAAAGAVADAASWAALAALVGAASAASGFSDAAVSAWDAVAAFFAGVGASLADGADAAGSALGDGAAAVGDALATAADAVADGVAAVADAIASLFGGAEEAGEAPASEAPVALPERGADGLLDEVTGRLPL